MLSLNNYNIENKKVLIRVDFNVPLSNDKIEDNTKIRTALPTIKLLLQQQNIIILATHCGRPDGKIVPRLSTKIVLNELQKYLPKATITFLPQCIGTETREKIKNAKAREILLLENLRFYQEEQQNDHFFAHSLASLADIYVNDAFAVSHRHHASVDAITKYLPACAGLQLEKEIAMLDKALHPQHPAIWIMGGAKLDKIDLLQQALQKADYLLIGGALAFAFLKTRKIPIGMSKTDTASVIAARTILKNKNAKKIILPIDFITATTVTPNTKNTLTKANEFQTTQMGLDLGPETIKLFKQYLRKAKTIIWNGPLGYVELAPYALATKEIARFIGKLTAQSICGGGETAMVIHKFHLEHNFTHVSTAGGAALEFLAGKKLPGITALEKNELFFKKHPFLKSEHRQS